MAKVESRFEKEYGFLRPVIKEAVERYLDCGNPLCGFALMNRSRFMRTAKRCPHPLSRLRRGAARHVLLIVSLGLIALAAIVGGILVQAVGKRARAASALSFSLFYVVVLVLSFIGTLFVSRPKISA